MGDGFVRPVRKDQHKEKRMSKKEINESLVTLENIEITELDDASLDDAVGGAVDINVPCNTTNSSQCACPPKVEVQ